MPRTIAIMPFISMPRCTARQPLAVPGRSYSMKIGTGEKEMPPSILKVSMKPAIRATSSAANPCLINAAEVMLVMVIPWVVGLSVSLPQTPV